MNHDIAHKMYDMCMYIVSAINPEDIWRRNDVFERVTSTFFNGSRDIIPEINPDYSSFIPNIAHMVWLGGGQMNFLLFLSVFSSYTCGQSRNYLYPLRCAP